MDKIYARIGDDGSVELPFGERELLRHRAGAIAEITLVGDCSDHLSRIAETQMLPLGVVVDGLRLRGCSASNEALVSLARNTDAHGTAGSVPEGSGESPVTDGDKGILVETDVIAAFLTGTGEVSLLERALATSMCYTTFVQLGEILACVPPAEHAPVMKALSLLRPLGAPPRYATELASFLLRVRAENPAEALRMAITATIARQSTLPVLTVRYGMVYSRLEISTINGNALRV